MKPITYKIDLLRTMSLITAHNQVSLSGFTILLCLSLHTDGCTIKSLVQNTKIERSNISHITKRLEDCLYVARSSKDLVLITQSGLNLLNYYL